jgi:hypothetical protein
MLELMGKMSFSSRFPQYLMTAILLGARPVLVTTHSFPSFPIAESSSHPPTHTQTETKETSNDDHNPLRKLEEAEDKTCNDHDPVSKLTCSKCEFATERKILAAFEASLENICMCAR